MSSNPRPSGRAPLRVLMIAPTSFFSDYGGHIRIMEEYKALVGLGHQVTIVTYYKGNDLPGVDIRRTAPLPWRADYEVGSSRHKLAFDAFLLAKTLRVGFAQRPHVIHAHMHEGALLGGVLARLLRVPLVFDFQGSLTAEMVDHGFLDRGSRVYQFMYGLERFISVRLPDAILTSTLQAGDWLRHSFGISSGQIVPLPDCADTVHFDPALYASGPGRERVERLRRRLGLPLDKTIVVYLGLMTDYQGIPQLLEAMRRLQSANSRLHLLLMGYPQVDHYRQMARAKGLADDVTLTGRIPFHEAPPYLALGDVAVAPKLSATEGSGKLLNYMAMALPVVAFDTAVNQEYLAELGCYAAPQDVDAFAGAIAGLAGDGSRRAALGRALRRRAVQHYSWQAAGQRIESLYNRLTNVA